MQTADATIRIQQLGGTWTTIGVDNVRGLYADPDSLTASANGYGPDQASFTLKRDPSITWPDLFAFSPVEIDIAGERVWAGRIKETPTTEGVERQINVSCEGWQYHLDDDTLVRSFVTLDMSGWQDARSYLTANLSDWRVDGLVQTGANGTIQIGYAPGNTWPANGFVGVILDQGPDPGTWAKRMTFDVQRSPTGGGTSQVAFYIRAATDPFLITNGTARSTQEDYLSGPSVMTLSTTVTTYSFPLLFKPAGTSGQYRYLAFFLWNSGAVYTVTGDDTIILSNIKLYRDSAYATSFTATRGIASTLDKATEFSSGADKTYYETVTGDTPVEYFRLSQRGTSTTSAGATSDDGEGNNLPLINTVGAPTVGTGLLVGDTDEATTFNGSAALASGDTSSFTSMLSTANWTIECLYKPISTVGPQIMVTQKTSSSNVYLEMRQNAGSFIASFTSTAASRTATAVGQFVAGNTYHCVATYDGANIRLYVNGALVQTTANTGTPDPGAGPFVIGGDVGVNVTGSLNGVLDEVAVYSYPLSAAQVAQHYKVATNGQGYGSNLVPTSFEIPEYAPADPKRARENIDALNAFHGWQFQIDEFKRPIYRPLPSVPVLETGAWAGSQFEDASANSGADIFSHAFVTATQADGSNLLQKVSQAVTDYTLESGVIVNPSAAVDASNWVPMATTGITLTRTTTGGEFVSGPGGFKAVGTATTTPFSGIITLFPGGLQSGYTFYAGKTYQLTATMRATSSGSNFTVQPSLLFGASSVGDSANILFPTISTGGGFVTYTATWVPAKDYDSSLVRASARFFTPTTLGSALAVTVFADDLYISKGIDPTLAGRWGFNKVALLPIQAKMTTAASSQIAETYLALHRSSPFRGSLTAQPGGLRDALSGENIHPSRALTLSQELIRFGHILDPESGSVGRHGRIATVSYTHSNQQASIDIDSTRKAFEALLERVGILQAARANLR